MRWALILSVVGATLFLCAPAPAGDVDLDAPGPIGLAYVGLYYGLTNPSNGSWYSGLDPFFGESSLTWMAIADTGASACIVGVSTQDAYAAGTGIPIQPYPDVKFEDVGFGGTADFKVTYPMQMMVAGLDTLNPDDTSAYTAYAPIAGAAPPALTLAAAIDPIGGGDIDFDLIGQSILQGQLLHVDPHNFEFMRWALFAAHGSLDTPAPAANDPRALHIPVAMEDFFAEPQSVDVGEHPMLPISLAHSTTDAVVTRTAIFDSGSPVNFVSESFATAAGIDVNSTPDVTVPVSGVGSGSGTRPGWYVETFALDLGNGREGDQLHIGNTAVFAIPDANMPGGLDAILGSGVFIASTELAETSLVEWYVDQRDSENASIILVFPEPVAIPGDSNVDGVVNIFDLATLANNYWGSGGWNDGDFTGDGTINVLDLAFLANNYTSGTTGGQAIPEPVSLLLFVAGLGGLVLRRR